MTMRVLDLFAGAGGWDLAIQSLGYDVQIEALELDDACCATRAAAGLPTRQVDVASLGLSRAFGVYDGLVASPPCQAFSKGGHRLGEDDPRGRLVHEPMRYVRALLPQWVAFEQVPEVLPVWRSALAELRTLGYAGYTTLLRAECFGLPQSRARAILVATRSPLLRSAALPPTASHAPYTADDAMSTLLLPASRGWADALALAPAQHVLSTGMDWREDGTSQERRGVFPAPTVGTKSLSQWHVRNVGPMGPSDRTGRTAGTRPVTTAELSALQGFPKAFPWQGTATEIGRQIGNAIPPTLARAVLAQLLLNEPR